MTFRVNELGLFQLDKKDIIKFNDGINIINGDSNTGKSSIGEIIDYCFGSSTLPIPKGKIVNEIDVFCIKLTLDTHTLLIARKRFNSDDDYNGKKFIFLKSITQELEIKDIDIKYFEEDKENFLTINDFKELEIIKYFSSFPPKTRLDGKEMVRPSIRNMIPFMFQTQDIIKNKTQLFYQLNKPTKIRGIKRDFELFLGLVKPDIYNKINRKNELIKEIKKIENREMFLEDELKKEYQNLKSHYYRFFSHLNVDVDLDDTNIVQDIKKESYLDKFEIKYDIDTNEIKDIEKLENKLNNYSIEIETLKIEHSNIKRQIKHLDTAQTKLKTFVTNNKYPIICPICHSSKEEKAFKVFIDAKKKIQEEEDFLNHYNIDILREKEQEIYKILEEKKEFFKKENNELDKLKKDVKQIKDMESKKQLLSEIKGMIKQTLLKIADYNEKINQQEKLTKLQDELDKIERELKKVDLKKRRYEAEYLIGKYATEVLRKLPFDNNSYGEANLKFDIKDVSAYQQGKIEIYKLNEIGSAENHLSFHLAVFLGLHKYILEHSQSILPSFIFLDQPSQVYFPKADDFKNKKGDIKVVENIYKTLIQTIENYNKTQMISKIQIIIVDHFYSDEEWYQKHLVEPRWEKDKNLGLIKD